ncbi:unnamed protein product [Phytophthora fragariaefolia]|uniref:Unnamed protein product n=1 Tax=Phytophthora fragariaefolia TaxID=1490495 RepID=A0A9W6Y0X0_9STRA|nr:unnamed protein product [Phytophthora fragariaefolia]
MGQRNSHGVPPDKVVSMFMRWEEDSRARSFTPQFEHARLTANPLSDGEVGGLTYLGLFLDDDAQQKLLGEIPLIHPNKLADHVTLYYRPNKQYARDMELGASFTIRGVEVVYDERGQTLRVELDDQLLLLVRNKIPHITMSMIDGVSASYSNELLESTTATRTIINPPIAMTVRAGAALFVQNQRVITTSSPFADEKKSFGNRATPVCSNLFVLYVNGSEIMNYNGEDTTKLLWRTQVQHHMGCQAGSRRVLCVQKAQTSSSPSLSFVLEKLQDQFLLDPTNSFDDVIEISLFHEFGAAISKYLDRLDTIKRVTVVTTVDALTDTTEEAATMQWALQDTSLSVIHIGCEGTVMQTIVPLAPACSTILTVLDLMGVSTDEESRSGILAGIRALDDAWASVLGTDDRQAAQRIDTTLAGLRSQAVELCLMLPSNVAPSDVVELQTKLLSALESSQSVRCVVSSCVPGQCYFSMSDSSTNPPVFCVRMITQPNGSVETVAAQLQFCESQLRASREVCEIEVYTVLTALLRAILSGRCGSLLPSECRLSSLVNLVAERLVLRYLSSICGVDALPTAEDTTSGRIISALYDLLTDLSTLSLEDWTAAFGDSLLSLQGNAPAQQKWGQAMAEVVQDCKSVLASYRCVGDGWKENPLSAHDHLRVLLSLTKAETKAASGATPVRAVVEVSSRSTWSQVHALACCDKLMHAAAMVLPQDDDAGFFFCAPSLVSRRINATASSLAVLRAVSEKLRALEADDALPFVLRRAETDAEPAGGQDYGLNEFPSSASEYM